MYVCAQYNTTTTRVLLHLGTYFLVGVHFHFLNNQVWTLHVQACKGTGRTHPTNDFFFVPVLVSEKPRQPTPKGPAPFIRSHRLGALLASLDDCRLDRHASLIPELERLGIDLAGAMARFDQ